MQNKYDDLMAKLEYEYVWPERHAPVTEEEIARFESRLGYMLPTDYREFLKKYGDTSTKTLNFLVRESAHPTRQEPAAWVEVFFGLGASAGYDIADYLGSTHDGWPRHFLPIASGPGGFVGLFLVGEHAGQIHWFGVNMGGDDPMDDTMFLAESFDAFMRSLFINKGQSKET